MKVHTALALSLTIPFARGYHFISARNFNLCGKLINGGSGFGRTEAVTVQARCLDRTSMRVSCRYTLPTAKNGELEGRTHICLEGARCLAYDNGGKYANPDAGCVPVFSPSGVKGAADTDNYACSSGIKVGNDPLYLLSSISTDKPALENSLTSCSIVRSGTQDAIYRHMPCPRTSVIIKLAARTTYQACVHTAIAVAAMSVGFTWHLDSPGKTRRDLGDKPLSEMFTVVGNSTASDGFRIVIGNGN